jgi:cell division protein FtsB/energy-coupling factor transporter ATP-binding protein EcfA2
LREKLRASRLVAVVGRSGCGKSSLVKAGLVPLLSMESAPDGQPIWHIASFRPRGQPIVELTKKLQGLTVMLQPAASERDSPPLNGEADANDHELSPVRQPVLAPEAITELRHGRLAAILRRNSQGLVEIAAELDLPETARLLIVVDQFEEIFRFEDPSGRNADEATAFVRLLMEAVSADNPKIHVILTMRLDFLGDCARFARLPEAISDGQYLVPNLSRAERRAAIEEPAKKGNKSIRPEVTQRLLNEIGEDPDQLPVLQHVLMRMWQQAGSSKEITLSNYEATGGVKNAISQHADQIYENLPTDADRLATERLFKAISERDLRGRFIRRITRFAEIEEIVAADNKPLPFAESSKKLKDVIEAYRAPDCCFLMPPVDEELVPATPIDISHESLLRGWAKMIGSPEKDGWINEEDRDGRTYRSLLEAAENDFKLSMKTAYERQRWWRAARPNAMWAKRYGNNFNAVDQFVAKSVNRSVIWFRAAFAFVLLVVGAALYVAYQEVQRQNYNFVISEYRANIAKLEQDQKRLNERNRELEQTILQARKNVSDSKARQELTNLLPDAADQRPFLDKNSSAPATLSSDTGFMWIGSSQVSNLNTPAGVPALPNAVRVESEYLTNLDVYLRQGLPDSTTYSQKDILPEGTHVMVLSAAQKFSQPTGDLYWAKVRVVKLALSTVYFQFAGGSRDQAQKVSKQLQDTGYKIPGEERSVAAIGKHEVRYFYVGQKTIADKLAKDATMAMQQLNYQSAAISSGLASVPIKSNPDGKLELWLEIPPK